MYYFPRSIFIYTNQIPRVTHLQSIYRTKSPKVPMLSLSNWSIFQQSRWLKPILVHTLTNKLLSDCFSFFLHSQSTIKARTALLFSFILHPSYRLPLSVKIRLALAWHALAGTMPLKHMAKTKLQFSKWLPLQPKTKLVGLYKQNFI